MSLRTRTSRRAARCQPSITARSKHRAWRLLIMYLRKKEKGKGKGKRKRKERKKCKKERKKGMKKGRKKKERKKKERKKWKKEGKKEEYMCWIARRVSQHAHSTSYSFFTRKAGFSLFFSAY